MAHWLFLMLFFSPSEGFQTNTWLCYCPFVASWRLSLDAEEMVIQEFNLLYVLAFSKILFFFEGNPKLLPWNLFPSLIDTMIRCFWIDEMSTHLTRKSFMDLFLLKILIAGRIRKDDDFCSLSFDQLEPIKLIRGLCEFRFNGLLPQSHHYKRNRTA